MQPLSGIKDKACSVLFIPGNGRTEVRSRAVLYGHLNRLDTYGYGERAHEQDFAVVVSVESSVGEQYRLELLERSGE